MRLMGYEISRETLLAFPAGSFFWARVSSLKPILELGLRWDDFAKEPIPEDGVLAHALERCLGLLPMLSQKKCYVYWAGRKCQDLPAGPKGQALIPLPQPNEMSAHVQTWFRMGWVGALSANKSPDKSFPLQRRLPDLITRNPMPLGVKFMIAGAQKAGTTALANYLRNHPQIYLPSQKKNCTSLTMKNSRGLMQIGNHCMNIIVKQNQVNSGVMQLR